MRQTDYTLREAELAEAERFWDENRPRLSELPTVDATYGRIDSLEEMALDGDPESRYGGKATNMARLQRLLAGRFER